VSSDGDTIANNELESTWKEAVMAYFKILTDYFITINDKL